ncbi:MAG: hypothetical protein WCD79_00355 [Chthoniobacteraceae bacterium]
MSARIVLQKLGKPRFEALTYAKHPYAELTGREVEWYSDSCENILGAVVLDLVDNDWSWVVLGRDEAGMYRAIDLNVSCPSSAKARIELRGSMRKHAATGASMFPQYDVTRKKNLLFEPVVPADKLCSHFKILLDDHHQAARGIIREIGFALADVDGNFAEQFQTTAFNARLWELFIYAFLHEQKFLLDRTHNRPDFVGDKFGFTLCVEAATVNPSREFSEPPPQTPEEMMRLLKDYMPIKFGSPLFSKLKKLNAEYKRLPHVKDKAFILALADFHQESSMTWSSSALTTYLYGKRLTWRKDADGKLHVRNITVREHRWKHKVIPSNFFEQPGAENLSAILFTNCGTLSKFNRMGELAGFGRKDVKMFRGGVYHNHDNHNATEPKKFYFEITPKTYAENWTQGVALFHNPNAKQPIPPQLFPGVAHYFLHKGRVAAVFPEFFPYSSQMFVAKIVKSQKRAKRRR